MASGVPRKRRNLVAAGEQQSGASVLTYHSRSSGVPSTAEAGDQFGDKVSLLERSGDRRLDAMIGTQYENRDVMWPSGTVTWLRATNSGLVAYGFLDSADLSTPFPLSNLGYSIGE